MFFEVYGHYLSTLVHYFDNSQIQPVIKEVLFSSLVFYGEQNLLAANYFLLWKLFSHGNNVLIEPIVFGLLWFIFKSIWFILFRILFHIWRTICGYILKLFVEAIFKNLLGWKALFGLCKLEHLFWPYWGWLWVWFLLKDWCFGWIHTILLCSDATLNEY